MNDLQAYHFAFGRHSNIPECCIRFFVNVWDAQALWRHDDLPLVRAINSSDAGYVQCPACLASGRVVQIVDCAIECGGDHYRDFEVS